MKTMAMRILKYIGLAALLAVAASCSIKDEDPEMEGPARVIISGHVLNILDNEPISGMEVEMLKIPTGGSGTQAPAQPQRVVSSIEGYYSFESYLDGETANFEIRCSRSRRDITVSRGDQSYDAKRKCYIIDMVDLFL